MKAIKNSSNIKRFGYKDNKLYITFFTEAHYECWQDCCLNESKELEILIFPFKYRYERMEFKFDCKFCEYYHFVPYNEFTVSYNNVSKEDYEKMVSNKNKKLWRAIRER